MSDDNSAFNLVGDIMKWLGPVGLIFGIGAAKKAGEISQKVERIDINTNAIEEHTTKLAVHDSRITSVEKLGEKHDDKLNEISESLMAIKTMSEMAKQDREAILHAIRSKG